MKDEQTKNEYEDKTSTKCATRAFGCIGLCLGLVPNLNYKNVIVCSMHQNTHIKAVTPLFCGVIAQNTK